MACVDGKYCPQQLLFNEFGETNTTIGVATDAEGDVFTTSDQNAVQEFVKTTSGFEAPVQMPSGTDFLYCSKIAVDPAGDVLVDGFTAEGTNGNKIVQIVHDYAYNAAGYSTPATYTVGHGFASVNGITTDSSGHVFLADLQDSLTGRFKLSSSGLTKYVSLPFSEATNPENLAVDNHGDVFLTDSGNNRVLESVYSGGKYSSPVVGLQPPWRHALMKA